MVKAAAGSSRASGSHRSELRNHRSPFRNTRPDWSKIRRWRRETDNPGIKVEEALGYDGNLEMYHGLDVPNIRCGFYSPFEPIVLTEEDEFITYRNERGIAVRAWRDGASMPEFPDYPVKTPSDWKRLKAERLRIDQDWDEFRARIANRGEAVQVGLFPYGVFGTPRDLLGVEELLVSFHIARDCTMNPGQWKCWRRDERSRAQARKSVTP